ncbi:MAG: cell division ATP-binding protein FtsE [Clostridia bacterium]|nr:cell division ATP-binding protein FtsE [Clostridia bacterium]
MIEFRNVTKRYDHDVVALSDINIVIDKGEFVFLAGPSGSGKSTFLKLMLKEEVPSEGTVIVNDRDLSTVKEREVPYVRRKIGCVFQDFRLLYDKTVYENIVLALRVVGASEREIKTAVGAALKQVGLTGREDSYPNQLSGGEQQRVGLARALVTRPPIIIADEPTGNLDDETAAEIMKMLYEINSNGTTIIMVTHDHSIIESGGKRVITLEKGKIVSDSKKGGHSQCQQEPTL